jgi:glycosyltransferase involved in cell wall biosynthesis
VLVDHVTFSKTGGAGEVASILATAQNGLGIDARLLNLVSGDLKSEPFTRPLITVAAALDEYMVSNHESPTILSLYRSRLSQLSLKALRSESVVHLHWLPGVMAHQQVRKLLSEGRKVVWTLHDMAPFTGVCHHSHGCNGFQGDCSDCPQVRNEFKKAVELNLTKMVFDRKEKNLILVAPTPWMANQARASSIFKDQRIEVIENPIRPAFFESASVATSNAVTDRSSHGSGETLRLTAVASDLTNPAKGIADLVDIVKKIRSINPRVHLQLVGGRGNSFHNPALGISWLGKADVSEMVQIARKTDLLVSASTAESAGLIVREFGAQGVPTLALRSGGMADLIQDGRTGFLASDISDLPLKLMNILEGNLSIAELTNETRAASTTNKPDRVSDTYLDAYRSLG